MICDFCLRERARVTKGRGQITTVYICNGCAKGIVYPLIDAQEVAAKVLNADQDFKKEEKSKNFFQRFLRMFGLSGV
jgi:hypothetical protein